MLIKKFPGNLRNVITDKKASTELSNLVQKKDHRKIISRPDPFSGSEFYLIHPDPLRNALDLSPSAPTSFGLNQIQPRASF